MTQRLDGTGGLAPRTGRKPGRLPRSRIGRTAADWGSGLGAPQSPRPVSSPPPASIPCTPSTASRPPSGIPDRPSGRHRAAAAQAEQAAPRLWPLAPPGGSRPPEATPQGGGKAIDDATKAMGITQPSGTGTRRQSRQRRSEYRNMWISALHQSRGCRAGGRRITVWDVVRGCGWGRAIPGRARWRRRPAARRGGRVRRASGVAGFRERSGRPHGGG